MLHMVICQKNLIQASSCVLLVGMAMPMPVLAQLNPNLTLWHQNSTQPSSCNISGPGNSCYQGPGGPMYIGTVGNSDIGAGIQLYRGPGINAKCCFQDCH